MAIYYEAAKSVWLLSNGVGNGILGFDFLQGQRYFCCAEHSDSVRVPSSLLFSGFAGNKPTGS